MTFHIIFTIFEYIKSILKKNIGGDILFLKFKIFFIFFLIFFLNEIDFSQIRPRIDEKILSGRQRINENILFGEEYAEKMKKSVEREFILEDAIDPKTYIIGPGDIILINLWGEQEEEFEDEIVHTY